MELIKSLLQPTGLTKDELKRLALVNNIQVFENIGMCTYNISGGNKPKKVVAYFDNNVVCKYRYVFYNRY